MRPHASPVPGAIQLRIAWLFPRQMPEGPSHGRPLPHCHRVLHSRPRFSNSSRQELQFDTRDRPNWFSFKKVRLCDPYCCVDCGPRTELISKPFRTFLGAILIAKIRGTRILGARRLQASARDVGMPQARTNSLLIIPSIQCTSGYFQNTFSTPQV
jgi:hypothetical protein